MEDSHGFTIGTMTSWMCQQVHGRCIWKSFSSTTGAPRPGEVNSTSSFEFGCWIHVWVWIASKKLASQTSSEPTNSLSPWINEEDIFWEVFQGPWNGHPCSPYWDKISITGWQWIEPIFVWWILPLELAKGKESKWNDVSTESLVPFFNTSFTGTVCWLILDFGDEFLTIYFWHMLVSRFQGVRNVSTFLVSWLLCIAVRTLRNTLSIGLENRMDNALGGAFTQLWWIQPVPENRGVGWLVYLFDYQPSIEWLKIFFVRHGKVLSQLSQVGSFSSV